MGVGDGARIPAPAHAARTEYPLLPNFRGPFRDFGGRVRAATGLSNEVRKTTEISLAWRSGTYAGSSVAKERLVLSLTEISSGTWVGMVGR